MYSHNDMIPIYDLMEKTTTNTKSESFNKNCVRAIVGLKSTTEYFMQLQYWMIFALQ